MARTGSPVQAAEWDFSRLGGSLPAPVESGRTLLLEALDLVRDEAANGEACRAVAEKAMEAGLEDIAVAAIRAFDEADFDMYVVISDYFAEIGRYDSVDQGFAEECEARVAAGSEARSGISFGDSHYTDQRSRALGMVGQYWFFFGDFHRAVAAWDLATDPLDVDEVIVGMTERIASTYHDRVQVAIDLSTWISTKSTRARALAALSGYV